MQKEKSKSAIFYDCYMQVSQHDSLPPAIQLTQRIGKKANGVKADSTLAYMLVSRWKSKRLERWA